MTNRTPARTGNQSAATGRAASPTTGATAANFRPAVHAKPVSKTTARRLEQQAAVKLQHQAVEILTSIAKADRNAMAKARSNFGFKVSTLKFSDDASGLIYAWYKVTLGTWWLVVSHSLDFDIETSQYTAQIEVHGGNSSTKPELKRKTYYDHNEVGPAHGARDVLAALVALRSEGVGARDSGLRWLKNSLRLADLPAVVDASELGWQPIDEINKVFKRHAKKYRAEEVDSPAGTFLRLKRETSPGVFESVPGGQFPREAGAGTLHAAISMAHSFYRQGRDGVKLT